MQRVIYYRDMKSDKQTDNGFLGSYAKVKIPGKAPIYLHKPKYVKGGAFICGYQVKHDGEPITSKGGDVLHLIQLGPSVKIVNGQMSKMYCEFEAIPAIDVTLTPESNG